jgi:hypothetical protein
MTHTRSGACLYAWVFYSVFMEFDRIIVGSYVMDIISAPDCLRRRDESKVEMLKLTAEGR